MRPPPSDGTEAENQHHRRTAIPKLGARGTRIHPRLERDDQAEEGQGRGSEPVHSRRPETHTGRRGLRLMVIHALSLAAQHLDRNRYGCVEERREPFYQPIYRRKDVAAALPRG